jgi:hypothetical protein
MDLPCMLETSHVIWMVVMPTAELEPTIEIAEAFWPLRALCLKAIAKNQGVDYMSEDDRRVNELRMFNCMCDKGALGCLIWLRSDFRYLGWLYGWLINVVCPPPKTNGWSPLLTYEYRETVMQYLPIMHAVEGGHRKVTEWMVRHNPRLPENLRELAPHIAEAAAGAGDIPVLDWLAQDLDPHLLDYTMASIRACKRGKTEALKWLLDRPGFPVRVVDMRPCLRAAGGRGHWDCLELLLSRSDRCAYHHASVAFLAACSHYMFPIIDKLAKYVDRHEYHMAMEYVHGMETDDDAALMRMNDWLMDRIHDYDFSGDMIRLLDRACQGFLLSSSRHAF